MGIPYVRRLFAAYAPPTPHSAQCFVEVRRPVRGRLLRSPRPRNWLGARPRGTHRVVRLVRPSWNRLRG